MTVQLVVANATVAATNFNPSVFSQLWLAQNNVIAAAEMQPGSIFTDVLVQAQATDFWIVVLPHQLQLMPRSDGVPGRVVRERIGRVVTLLPHVPYTAVGLNFVWHSDPMSDPGQAGRRLIADRRPPFDRFDSPDARFGAYASVDVDGARLRLDIRPFHALDDPKTERMQFAFNFERLLADQSDKPSVINDVIGRWDAYQRIAKDMVEATLETASA